MAASCTYHVGIDENGLGPRLGPLVVTGVLGRVREGGAGVLERLREGAVRERLGDSKGLVAHGDVALAEAWARAVVARGAGRSKEARPGGGVERLSAAELVAELSLDDRAALRAPCPAHVEAQCWSTASDPRPSERVRELTQAVSADLDGFEQAGFELVAVRSVIVCAKRINGAVTRGQSRLVVDLGAMVRLLLQLRATAGTNVTAVCGKVGGYRAYGKVLGALGSRIHQVVEETPARSAYGITGLGEVAFVRDADDSDALVGLASLVGKYLRELLMGRIVSHYRTADESLPDASGYNDAVTTAFIAATEGARRAQQIPDTCFERLKRGDGS